MLPLLLFLLALLLLRGGLWVVRAWRAVPRRNADFGWPR
jgi:hypothetical protein